MSLLNEYFSNTSVKDLNLDLTVDDLNNFDKLDDPSKQLLNLEALTNQSKFAQLPTPVTDTTTINPNAVFINARQYVQNTDQWAKSGINLEPVKTPLSEIQRYDKSGFATDKRIGPEFVYDRDNEDWMAQNESVWANLGKGLLRLPISTGYKIGQSAGFIAGLIDPTNWGDNYIQNASQNAMAQAFGHLDEQLKNEWLPVYQKAEAQGAGFWWRATHDMNFWTSDFVDGVAFMVSAFAPGMAFSRLGVGEKIARGLSGYKWGAGAANGAIEGAASVENYLTKAQSIWANRLDRVAQWSLSVGGESMFETTEVGKNIKKGLTYDEKGILKINPNTGLPYTEEEKNLLAASHMKETFMANAAILSATNAMELKWLNSIMGKSSSKAVSKGLMGGTKLGDELAYELSNLGMSKFLNSKTGVFLSALGKGTLMEGFVEENAQLAIQRVNEQLGVEGKMAELKDTKTLANQFWNQTLNAISGKDPEASISIGLGGILGGGMSVYSKLKEAKRNDEFTKAAVKFYNESEQNWLKFGNIFETRMVTRKDEKGNEVSEEEIILDKDGKAIVNESKLFNVANNFNNVNSAIDAANTVGNKFKRDLLRDSAFASFVQAHIQLGLEKTLIAKLDAAGRTEAGELAKLGFTADETTQKQIEKYKGLTQQIIDQNKILNDDIIFKTDWRGRILPEEDARKNKMTEIATRQAVYTNLLNETFNDNNEFKNQILKQLQTEDIGLSDDLADQLNDLQLRINSQRRYLEELEMGEKKPIEKALAKTILNELETELSTLKKNNPEALKVIKKAPDGFYQYEKSTRNQVQNIILRNKLYERNNRVGELKNHIRQLGLEWAKYADTKNGMANFKEYIDNVIVKPFNEIADRAERGKSGRFTDEERKERREQRTGKRYEEGTPWVKKGTNATFLYRMKDDDRIAEDIMEYYDVQDGETVTLLPVLQKMINNPYIDPYLKTVLSGLINKVGIEAKVKFDRKQTIAPGFYTLETNTITIDPDLHEGKMSFEGVMLHELIHLLTSDELAYNSKFTRDIEQLYEYAKKSLEDRGIDTSYYGFTNVHEFLAEAYSNPEFQKELQSIPGKTGKKSIWTDFIDALSNFFKSVFNLEVKPSVLDDIFFKVEEYLGDDIYQEAVRQFKENGLTDEEIDLYSKRELIDMALNEGYITDELIVQRKLYPREIEEQKRKEEEEKRKELEKQNQQGKKEGQEKTEEFVFDDSQPYVYNNKQYDVWQLGDNIYLNSLSKNPDDDVIFTIEEFQQALKTGKVKFAKDVTSTTIPDTVEEYLSQMYEKSKAAAEVSGRAIPPYEVWEKTAGKFERERYEKLKGSPKSEEKPEEYKIDDRVVFEDKEYTVAEITKTQDGRVVYHLKDLDGKPLVATDGVKRFVEASNLKRSTVEPEERVDYFDQIKVNNEFTDAQGNIYKIASVIPGKAVNYILTNNASETTFGKELLNDFLAKLENGTYTLSYTEFVEDESAVKDYVQNNRFETTGLQSTRVDNDTANVTYQEGRRQLSPHNSLANTTDIAEFRVSGTNVTQVRTGVNTNYVFDVATGNFPEGSSLTYRVMTKDFPAVTNRITGEVYNASDIFDASGKVKEGMYAYAPIGVYAVIEGKEKLIGTIHEPQWINHKIGNKYVNIAIPEDQLDMDLPTVVKEEVAKNEKFRKFILDNFNKDSSFQMNGIVEGKSIGILKNLNDPGLLKDRVNPKISEGGTENRHGMFAIVRNGELQVDAGMTIDGIEDTKSFTDDIDNQNGVSVLLLPTPRGTFFPTYVKLPKVSENNAKLIIEAWKAFTGETANPKLIESIYKALGMEMSEGKPDIGVLQKYVDHYITSLKKEELSEIGNGTDVANGLARINITSQGHLYIQVKSMDGEWFNNDGKPIVLSSELPGNVISLMQNLITTVKFTNPKSPNLVGINNPKKVPFVTIENNQVKVVPMTYNEYVMQGAMTYVENGTPSKNKDGDWVYFANPVIKMSSNTEAIVVKPKDEEVVVGDTFEAPPVTITSSESEILSASLIEAEIVKEDGGAYLLIDNQGAIIMDAETEEELKPILEKYNKQDEATRQKIKKVKPTETKKEEAAPVSTDVKYSDLKAGQVLNVISKEIPSVTGTLTVTSENRKDDFIRFDINFSNGTKENAIGYSEKEFNDLFKLAQPIVSTDAKADIERKKSLSQELISFVWERLAKKGITNADSVIGTRETIDGVDFDKFWSNVTKEDLQNLRKLYETKKLEQLDLYNKFKGEFDSSTGTITSNDTSFFDNKIKNVDAELADLEGGKPTEAAPPVITDLDDIFGQLDRIATANEMTDEQVEEESKKCKTKGKTKK
jgi:hypothetical protein